MERELADLLDIFESGFIQEEEFQKRRLQIYESHGQTAPPFSDSHNSNSNSNENQEQQQIIDDFGPSFTSLRLSQSIEMPINSSGSKIVDDMIDDFGPSFTSLRLSQTFEPPPPPPVRPPVKQQPEIQNQFPPQTFVPPPPPPPITTQRILPPPIFPPRPIPQTDYYEPPQTDYYQTWYEEELTVLSQKYDHEISNIKDRDIKIEIDVKKIRRIDPIIDKNTSGIRGSAVFDKKPQAQDSIMVFRKTKQGVFQTPPLLANETANSVLTFFGVTKEGYLVDQNGVKYVNYDALPKGKIYFVKENDNRKSKNEYRKHQYTPLTAYTGRSTSSYGLPSYPVQMMPAEKIKIDPKKKADLEFRVKMADNARKNNVGAKFPREISKYVNELVSSSDPKMKVIVSNMKEKPVIIGEKKIRKSTNSTNERI